jgi:RNA polymerase sigma factor (sigma-70 family)
METSTVLFLAANPVRLAPLQLGVECRLIEDKIRRSKFSGQIRFRPRWAARPDDLMEALNEDAPSVLHFSGHGDGDQGLCFQSDDGSALRVSADALAQVMRAAGSSVEIVVLNACFSEAQARALIAVVPCVVGMPGAIGDRPATIYASAFYRALASGRSVANAHEQGIAALALPYLDGQHRDVESSAAGPQASPQLLTRSGTNADSVYLVGAPVAKRRCLVVIKATMRDFDDEVLARVTAELRQLTGDFSLTITDIEEGSVRLKISLSPAGAQALLKLRARGQLSSLHGFEVEDVVELVAAQALAKSEVVAQAAVQGSRVVRERARQRVAQGGAHGSKATWTPSEPAEVDGDILVLAETGNATGAVRLLMRRYGTAVYRYCRSELRDAALTDDVHQHVFIQVFRDLSRFNRSSTLRVWLFAIARNRVLDALKQRRRQLRARIPESTTNQIESWLSAGESIDDERLRTLVRESLDHLSEKARTAVILHYGQGLTFEEMSRILGERPKTLHGRVARAISTLRESISRAQKRSSSKP